MRLPHGLTTAIALVAIGGCATQEASSADARAAEATQRLAATGAPEVTVRRLSTDAYVDFYAASISPDGRYMSMVDWSTADLAVKDLASGRLHRLTHAPRGGDGPYEDAGVSVFSRDGRRIAVGWQVYPLLQLRVLDFEADPEPAVAGPPRVIFDKPEFEPYYPYDWSPDGDWILAKVYAAGNTNQLALISSTGGSYRPLKSFDWREPTRAGFSPDGRFVAYDMLPVTDSPDRDVYVLSIDGASDRSIVSGPSVDRLLGWHPDGSILFHSDRGDTPGVWRVPVSDGRVAGPIAQVKADLWNVEALGFVGDRFAFGVSVNPRRMYTAAFDPEAGGLVGTPTAVEDRTYDILGWAWSEDGRLAYSASAEGVDGSYIVIRAEDGRQRKRFRTELGPARHLRWTPDGRGLVVFARDARAGAASTGSTWNPVRTRRSSGTTPSMSPPHAASSTCRRTAGPSGTRPRRPR